MAPGAQARRPVLGPAEALAGRWAVRRALHDRRLGHRGSFEGVAAFTPEGDGLRWHEAGRMRFARHDGPAERTLHVVRGEAGWEVRFPDGRLFHPLDLRTGACDAVHPCGADVYRGRYVLEGPDRLVVTWRVTGPEADETLDAVYTRLG